MPTGRVKKWIAEKGIGWIEPEGGGAEVFFGDRALRGVEPHDIAPGLAVAFDVGQGAKGPQARNVRPTGAPVIAGARSAAAMPDSPAGPIPMPIPRSTERLIRRISGPEHHPGLRLDKYFIPPKNQEAQRPVLDDVTACRGFGDDLASDWLPRRRAMLTAIGAEAFEATTAGRLTLHLARASSLENAGIALHPIYGFAYLPATGIKGMARAYAETIWSQATEDGKAAKREIDAIFGSGGTRDAACGDVVFHDAWPTKWPQLVVDIVNNHHPDYYGKKAEAPGDWGSPQPVSFLAIPSGTRFQFAVLARRPGVSAERLRLARLWIEAALLHLGAGAKTAAGYGAFAIDRDRAAAPPGRKAVHEAVLELVTPAFLAGARQEDPADCDLRPATLRGLLRWWWRTLHAGFVDVPTLRQLEAAVWGDTKQGSPVRITVQPMTKAEPTLYRREDVQRTWGLPRPPDRKTSQGIAYLSYGMADGGRQSYFLAPGARWKIRLSARRFVVDEKHMLPAETVLGQAKAALWLLCRFGGVGSKARKGFGSFADLAGHDLARCKKEAQAFRVDFGLPSDRRAGQADSACLEHLADAVLEIPVPWPAWFALDQLGSSVQTFAKGYKHNPIKFALGLPRTINGRAGKSPKGARHASPIHFHVAQGPDGAHTIRAIAFVAPFLPSASDSQKLLSELLAHLRTDLARRAREVVAPPPNATKGRSGASPAPRAAAPAGAPRAGEKVRATLIEEKTKKGGWQAQVGGLGGPIIARETPPADWVAGLDVDLTVNSVSDRKIDFRWPPNAPGAPKRR